VTGEAFWWEKYKAVSWTSKQLTQNIGGDKYIFVEFYTKACHFCEKLYPKMNKIIEEFSGPKGTRKDIVFVKVDGEKRSALLDELGVEEYPTMFLFKPGNKKYPDRYVWDHSLEDIRGYLLSFPPAPGFGKKELPPTTTDKKEVSEADQKELEALKKRIKELEAIQKDTDFYFQGSDGKA
jgi:thiol-disulfide isomerase/thioredoxin